MSFCLCGIINLFFTILGRDGLRREDDDDGKTALDGLGDVAAPVLAGDDLGVDPDAKSGGAQLLLQTHRERSVGMRIGYHDAVGHLRYGSGGGLSSGGSNSGGGGHGSRVPGIAFG